MKKEPYSYETIIWFFLPASIVCLIYGAPVFIPADQTSFVGSGSGVDLPCSGITMLAALVFGLIFFVEGMGAYIRRLKADGFKKPETKPYNYPVIFFILLPLAVILIYFGMWAIIPPERILKLDHNPIGSIIRLLALIYGLLFLKEGLFSLNKKLKMRKVSASPETVETQDPHENQQAQVKKDNDTN